MLKSLPKLFPTSTETYGVAFVAFMIVLLGNAKDLLDRYGLLNSSKLVQGQLSNQVGSGLGKLDSLKFTDTVVTFAVWGIVGLVSFSVLQAVLRTSKQKQYEKTVSSSQYVHPVNFKAESFWRQVWGNFALSFGLLLFAVATAVLYVTVVLPKGFTDARKFLLHVSAVHIVDLLLGLAIVFAGTYLLYTALRLSVRHHRITRAA